MGDAARDIGTVLISLGAIGAAAFVFLRPKKASAATESRSPRERTIAPSAPPPSAPQGAIRFAPLVERWRAEVAKRAGDLPVDAILRWIEIESGGDMSSSGIPGREAGIFQLDFPSDEKYGATYADLMAMSQRSKGRAHPNDISWLTDKDLDMQVGAGIRKMMAARDQVRQVFASSGVTWPEASFDFGSAVKQIHAAPAVISELVPKIARMGGPPVNWADLRHKAIGFPVDQMGVGLRALANSPSKHGLQNRLEDTLANAEEFGHTWAASPRVNAAAVAGWGIYT